VMSSPPPLSSGGRKDRLSLFLFPLIPFFLEAFRVSFSSPPPPFSLLAEELFRLSFSPHFFFPLLVELIIVFCVSADSFLPPFSFFFLFLSCLFTPPFTVLTSLLDRRFFPPFLSSLTLGGSSFSLLFLTPLGLRLLDPPF